MTAPVAPLIHARTLGRVRKRRISPTRLASARNHRPFAAIATAASSPTKAQCRPPPMNCGISAVKNTAALGLSRLHSSPERNASQRLIRRPSAISAAGRERSLSAAMIERTPR